MTLIVVLATTAPILPAQPDTPPLYRELAAETLDAFQAGSFAGMKERFSASFLSKVPLASMNSIPDGYQSRFGTVIDVVFEATRDDPQFGSDTLYFWVMITGDRRAVMRVKLDAAERIDLWHLGPSEKFAVSFDEIRSDLDSTPGQVSAFAARVGGDGPLFAFAESDMLAIGSSFKLWVLAELMARFDEGTLATDSVIGLQTPLMSAPSGRLHTWPDGAPLTAYSLAAMMISESDNTATDHLMDLLGRQRVEDRVLEVSGSEVAGANQPFLRTRELFLLGASGEPWESYRSRYIAGSIEERRALLEELANAYPEAMPSISHLGGTYSELEWYASTRDLVKLMEELCSPRPNPAASSLAIARGILAINPGIANSPPDERISYLAYKGGSEPGVLNFTQYVGTASGQDFVVSMTCNDSDLDIDEAKFVSLFRSLRRACLDALGVAPARD